MSGLTHYTFLCTRIILCAQWVQKYDHTKIAAARTLEEAAKKKKADADAAAEAAAAAAAAAAAEAEAEAEAESAASSPGKNAAFIFLKPHACTDKARELLSAQLVAKEFTVLTKGEITGTTIDEKM